MRRPTVALLVTSVLLVASLVPTASQASAGPPLLLQVDFPGEVSEVRVAAVPQLQDASVGDVLRDGEVGARVVDHGAGRLTIAVEPEQVPQDYVGDGGVVDFRVSARGPDGAWTKNTSARAVAIGKELVWVDPVTSGGAHLVRTRNSVFPRVTGLQQAAELEDAGVWVSDYSMPVYASYCLYEMTSEWHDFWATVATTYPIGKTTATAEISSTSAGRYGVAFALPGRGWAGASGGRYVTSQSSWGWRANPVSHSRSYRNQVRYHRFELWCTDYTNGRRTWHGSELRPVFETGGTQTNSDLARPSWNSPGYCVPVDPGQYWRSDANGFAYSYSAGVKAAGTIGFDLLSEKQYGSGHKLDYFIVGNNKRMCGSNAKPAFASKIVERYRT